MKYLLILFSILSTSIGAQVLINEYSAANYDETDFLAGPGENYSDWIELYNAGSNSVNMGGYYLTDRANKLQKWAIPAGTTIAAGARLVFLADGADTFSGGFYHTNFKLTQTKGNETIVLSNAVGTVLDSISLNYPNKKNDSRARLTDGNATWGIQETPNPGTANNTTHERYCLKPVFDIAPGFYTVAATVTVNLSTTEPNSSIRYTLDGSEPNMGSTLYSTPISMTTTTVIRAKTFSGNPNILSSHTETNTYFINTTHTTKVVSISGGLDLDDLLGGTQNEPQGALELFETDGTFLTESTGEFNKHGNDSWAYNQRGVDYITRDQFGNNYALLDKIFDNKNRDEFQKVILKCGASDNYPFEGQANNNYFGEFGGAHIRDAYVNEMSQLGDLRLDERSNEFAVMYVNGAYWGIYDIREKVDDHDFTNHYYDQDEDNIQYMKTWGSTEAEYGGIQAEQDWADLVDFITLNDMTIASNYAYVDSVFNTGSLIDYFILNGFIVNADWLNWNTSWWRGLDPSGDKKKWRYSLWDMDATFNHYVNFSGIPNQGASSDPCDPATLPDLGGQGHVPIWNALNENDDFFADYANRYAELSSTVFSCDSMHNLLNKLVAEISGEMPAHIIRWGGTMTEWQENVDSLHAFIDTRCADVIAGLVNCDPNLSGPYQLTLEVFPAGAGKIELSSVTPTSYPFTSTYFGGVDISLTADPNQCWELDYWTIANDTISPDSLSNTISFDLSADDTVAIYFKPKNCIYIDVQPPGAGKVTVNGNILNNYPNIEGLSDSTNHSFTATANAGYTFANWDWNIHNPAPSTTSTNTIVYTYTNDTVIANFTAITPLSSDTIVYTINTAGAGSINVNGANISAFPSTQYYNSGANATINASANAGFMFSSWNFNNNTPTPNTTTNNISVTWLSNDTVQVNFNTIPSHNITYIVDPAGAGTIDINGANISAFPNTATYLQGANNSLTAQNSANYQFSYWESNSSTLNPSINSNSVNFNTVADDTIIAHYDLYVTDTLWVITKPAGVASLNVGSDLITSSPYMGIYELGAILNIEANPIGTSVFNQWNLNNLSLADYNESTFFIFNGQDTLFAYFDNVLGVENLGEDISSMKLYPTLVKNEITFEALAKENGAITIDLYSLSGQKIQTLYEGNLNAKTLLKEKFTINTSNGIYFVKVSTTKTNATHKIVVIN